MIIRKSCIVTVTCLGVLAGTMSVAATQNTIYRPDWESLKNYQAPEWYEDAKLGLWVHWGVYSVPAYAGDHAGEWYDR